MTQAPGLAVRVAIAGIVAGFLVLALLHPGMPAFYYDEVIYVPVSLTLLGETDISPAIGHRIGGWPITQSPVYIGALKAHLMAPVFALFGVGYLSVRLPMVLLTAIALALFARFLLPRVGAPATVAILLVAAADPALTIMTKVDWGPVAIANALKLLLLASVVRFVETGRTAPVAWAAAAAAVGMFDKVNFVWVVGAVGLATPIMFPRQVAAWIGGRPREVLLLVAACLPVFAAIFWFQVRPSLSFGGGALVEDAALGQRLAVALALFVGTFDGSAVYGFFFRAQPEHVAVLPRLVSVQAVLGLAALVAVAAGVKAGAAVARWLGFLTIVLLLLAAQIVMTTLATGAHHLIILWPFLHLQLVFCGLWLVALLRAWRPWAGHAATGLVAATVAVVTAGALASNLAYQREFARGEAQALFDPVIDRTVAALDALDVDAVVSGDWGLHNPIVALTQKRGARAYPELAAVFAEALPRSDGPKHVFTYHLAGRRSAIVVPAHEMFVIDRPAVAGVARFLDAAAACIGDDFTVADSRGRPIHRIVVFDGRRTDCLSPAEPPT